MYRGLFFADIHIGAMSYDQTYEEVLYIRDILKEYTRESLLDFIVIGGDFFDKQFYINDDFIKLAMRLMTYLMASTKVLRVVYGTSSHDSDQYILFDALIKDIPSILNGFEYNFKVITTVQEEELLPNMNVLYIPEEYVYNKSEYYKPFLETKNKYDYIFGHGMIYEAFKGKIKKEETENTSRRKAPIFSSGELAYACKGDVLFGHYHIHTEMKDNVSYVGSFSRWKFGEEEDKGFFQLSFDFEKSKYTKSFVINEKALKYVTISYGYKDSVFESSKDMERTVENIMDKKEKYKIDMLKIVFNIPVGYDATESLIKYFTDRFKNDKSIKIEFNNGYVEQKRLQAKEKILNLLSKEDRIFLDKNIPEEEKISIFIKMKRGVDISPKKIKEYLKL